LSLVLKIIYYLHGDEHNP